MCCIPEPLNHILSFCLFGLFGRQTFQRGIISHGEEQAFSQEVFKVCYPQGHYISSLTGCKTDYYHRQDYISLFIGTESSSPSPFPAATDYKRPPVNLLDDTTVHRIKETKGHHFLSFLWQGLHLAFGTFSVARWSRREARREAPTHLTVGDSYICEKVVRTNDDSIKPRCLLLS